MLGGTVGFAREGLAPGKGVEVVAAAAIVRVRATAAAADITNAR